MRLLPCNATRMALALQEAGARERDCRGAPGEATRVAPYQQRCAVPMVV
jgi:hypothetical protein